MRVEHLTADTFTAFTSRLGVGVGVVQFWAAWDNFHLYQRHQIEMAVERASQPVRFAMLDTDDPTSYDLLRGVQWSGVELLLYYRDGQRVAVQVGVRRSAQIAAVLSDVLSGLTPGRV